MVLGKLFRVYHKTDKNNTYSVLLENKNDKSETLLFESGAIGVLSTHETESVKSLYSLYLDVYGCLGVLNLTYGNGKSLLYLVCITGCVSVGKIQGSEIFCITDITFISLNSFQEEIERVQDVKKILISGTFYFSWSPNNQTKFDLTLCAQKYERTQCTDNRFFWNRMLYLHMKSFDVNTEKWLLKVMCGGVSINTVYVGHLQAKACLISRLSCERAGTRFNVRGTNDNGHVANFVETEQVIFLENKVASFIIIRGSIPLFWEQTGVQVGSHKLKMSRGCEISQPAFDRHLALIQYLYGNQVIVNLVGNKEGEYLIGSMFKAHHKNSRFKDNIPYIAFDYHYYCPRGKEDNLSIIREQIKKYYDEFSFYLSKDDIHNYQTGTFRVNCIDCLDRTNRVQTFIGLEILSKQLKTLGLDDKATVVSRFHEVYKNMWQINGDQVSRIYAGTGALEGKSKLRDGTLSVARTIQNNLLDNIKQEAIDILLTGKQLNSEFNDKTRSILPLKYLHLPSNILLPISERYLEYATLSTIKVAVGTWNVNGGKHFNSIIYKKSDPLSDWLLDANKNQNNNIANILDLSLDAPLAELNENSPDLFAIGFEEIVDLNAQNIMTTSTTNQKEWLSELEKTLSRNESYVLVTSVQLVGVCLFLFTKPKLARFIRDVSTDQVKTGLGGAAGNKGGVGIRLVLYNTSLCFICSHFAAGQNQFNERNSDYKEISRKIFSSIGKYMNTHDYVFWCGDFNYRIDLGIDEVKKLVKEQNWDRLLSSDQLKNQQSQGKTFRGFKEGQINFAPTYKYDINSDDYDTSEKSRIPAWTDRVLFRKNYPTTLAEKDFKELNYGEIMFYGRAELKTSDHRPVLSEFKIDVLKVDNDKRTLVFREIVEKMGPPDSTVIIKEEPFDKIQIPNEGPIFEDIYVQEILKKLNEEIGTIVLARFGQDHMRITFKDGTMALKLSRIHTINVLDKTFSISLKTPNWLDLIEEEINYGVNNTLPLLENCKKFSIDDLNDYEVFKLSRPTTPCEKEIVATSFVNQTTMKPVRPAPPPPKQLQAKEESLSDDGLLLDSSNELNPDNSCQNFSFDSKDESFNLPPPSVPPPLLTGNLDVNASPDLTNSFEDSPPNSPEPNIPPPSMPPPSIPPPVPSRRPAPMVPPRNS